MTGNGSLTGNGVTLYFACSAYPTPCGNGQSGATFSMTGNGTVSLSAPTSGTFQGVSIFVDRKDTATDTLTGLVQGSAAPSMRSRPPSPSPATARCSSAARS